MLTGCHRKGKQGSLGLSPIHRGLQVQPHSPGQHPSDTRTIPNKSQLAREVVEETSDSLRRCCVGGDVIEMPQQ